MAAKRAISAGESVAATMVVVSKFIRAGRRPAANGR